MKQLNGDTEHIYELINYYKDKGLTIIGLNDSQGVNITSTFFKKGLLEYLATTLTSDELTPQLIDAFSLTMNKTEHIDYFLKNNLTLEEIKLSQIYSVVSALEKVALDVGLPKILGQVGNAYRLIYNPNPCDSEIKIATSLQQASEPILIYSSGVNNLMREVGSNPFGIKRDYKLRDKQPNYYYTLDKTNNPDTLGKVINSIEKNFKNILSINNRTDIYALGAYIPKSLESKEMNIFRDLVIQYNKELYNLCNKYRITFINTEEIGKNYNKSKVNFHVTTAGHNALAMYILDCIYENKIQTPKSIDRKPGEISNISSDGVEGVIKLLSSDYDDSYDRAMKLSGYAKERELRIAAEHKRENEIFQKVLANKIK